MPLFSELRDLVRSGAVQLSVGGAPLDTDALALSDFHALRALAHHYGWLAERALSTTCRNCDGPLEVVPCARLAAGPFEDGELADPELDGTRAFGEPCPIPPVRLPGGRVAATVRFAPVTAGAALPMHRALRRRTLTVTPAFVRAMGLVALGDEADPRVIAPALARASEEAWSAIGDAFLDTHYPPRLFAAVACPRCGARNDVDAPFERELDRAAPPSPLEGDGGEAAAELAEGASPRSFPPFEGFCDAAEEARARLLPSPDALRFVVEGGVAACDEGGEPLLGAYVPAWEGSATEPSRPAEITVYYRTFRALWDEEPYDWRAELDETIAHEWEHHEAALAGDDPVDRAERAAILREATRVVGRRALARGAVRTLGRDLTDFFRRTWPLWLLLVLLTLAVTLGESGSIDSP